MPSLLISIFAIAVILRAGTVGYDYYDNWLSVQAKTNKPEPSNNNPTKTDNLKNDKPKLTTIQDKILKKDTYKSNETHFSSKTGTKIMDKNPNDVCITSVMLQDTIKQITYLDKRSLELEEQQKLLETSDRRIREQIAKLKLIKDDIIKSAKLADSKIQREGKRLISIYEKMKPKEAANIFNEMAPNIAAELLRTMKEDQSSQILSKMNPKNAYEVTLSLAGGIKNTKDQYNTIR